ncbi:MAG TPA: hypothetical protein VN924_11525 [Bryobacteraceae bacterium]|nr:hypothetical protein [Bryobacteraceae bacterium]
MPGDFAILSGRASGVFFHEIFGHRVEGQRQKNSDDAQTFRKKINELVKGRRVEVVENGILKTFLISRTPVEGIPQSNGHGRAQMGFKPVGASRT